MAGYRVNAAVPGVLARLTLAVDAGGAHLPAAYSVFVAAAEAERWAEVTCSCGGVGRVDWIPGGTADFRSALAAAWAERRCATSGAPAAAR